MAEQTHWTLDKRVPLAFLLAILVQTAGIVWWASNISGRVETSEKRLTTVEAVRAGERLAVLESTVSDVRSYLARIEGKVDRLIEAKSPHP